MQIYDGFTFFNELELLEIRLNILNRVVDKFVLVESNVTFTGEEKPLYFKENYSKFENFLDKIIHVIVEDMPLTSNPWTREIHQRNAIVRGLSDAKPGDRILISDVDEIPRPESVGKTVHLDDIVIFLQEFYYYFLNCKTDEIWKGTRMVPFEKLKTPQEARFSGKYAIKNAGWHFSYLGGIEAIIKKIQSFSHQEFNTPYFKDPDRIISVLESGADLFDRPEVKWHFSEVDITYPKYVIDNIDRFRHLIK